MLLFNKYARNRFMQFSVSHHEFSAINEFQEHFCFLLPHPNFQKQLYHSREASGKKSTLLAFFRIIFAIFRFYFFFSSFAFVFLFMSTFNTCTYHHHIFFILFASCFRFFSCYLAQCFSSLARSAITVLSTQRRHR